MSFASLKKFVSFSLSLNPRLFSVAAVIAAFIVFAGVQATHASNTTVSGTVYTDEGTTAMASGRTVRIKVNGGGDYSATTDGSGAYSIANVSAGTGDIVTTYLDGATEKAATVTRSAGADITGLDLYQNYLIVRSEDGSALTNANLGMYDADNDADIKFTSNSGTLTTTSTTHLLLNTSSTFAPGGAVTVNGSFKQTAGTFTGGSAAMTVNGNFTLSGGTFTATSGTFLVWYTWTHTAGGTFNHNNGTIQFQNGGCTDGGTWDFATSETFYNFVIDSQCYGLTLAGDDTLIITGTLTENQGPINSGTIEARGDVVVNSNTFLGSGTVAFLAAGDQTITSTSNGDLANLNINKPSGTVTLTGNLHIRSLTLSGGTFTSTSGTLILDGTWTHTAGGTFNHNNGTVQIQTGSGCGSPGTWDVSTTETFYNFAINTNCYGATVADGDTFIVLNDLVLTKGVLNSGVLEVRGNISVASGFSGGAGIINLTGSNTQILTNSGGTAPTGLVTINKINNSDMVTLASNYTFAGGLTITKGTFSQGASYNVTTGSTLTVSADGTWSNTGTGDIVLGGNVSNSGTVTLSSGALDQCTDGADDIAITSSSSGTQRTWSGSGTYNLYNLDVTDMLGALTVYNSSFSNSNWLSGMPTGCAWWNDSYQSRRKITFDNSASAEDLTDFPVLVRLTSSNIDYSKTRDAGEDIRFVDADDTTVLPYEIEKWDESGESLVWVKVPQINAGSTTDNIWIYYNNPSAADGQDADAVWNSNFKSVYHFPDAVTLSADDSTANGNDGTLHSATAAAGEVGGSASFSGSSSYIDTNAALLNGLTGVSVSYWAKGDGGAWGQGDSSTSSFMENTRVFFRSGTNQSVTISNPYDASAWHYYTVTSATNSVTVYKDGAVFSGPTSTSTRSAITSAAANNFQIGTVPAGTSAVRKYFTGSIDEFRVSSSIRSADWTEAEYLFEKDDAKYTYGSEENSEPEWWNDSWLDRRKITLDNSASAENLVDFPVLVRLTSSKIDYALTQNSGQDLRFVDADNATALPYEIEKWDESGESLVWVKVPQIDLGSTADNIWMYYNNPGAADGQSPSSVWDSNYRGVWHLSSGNDSTSNASNISASTATTTTGIAAAGAHYQASSSQGTTASNQSLYSFSNSTFTTSVWARSDSASEGVLVAKNGYTGGWVIFDSPASNGVEVIIKGSGGNSVLVTAPMPNDDNWHYITAVMTTNTTSAAGNSVLIYVDGQLADSQSDNSSGKTYLTNADNVTFGRRSASSPNYYDGDLDEVRISRIGRSADWIEAEYLFEKDNSKYTFGAQEGATVADENASGGGIPRFGGGFSSGGAPVDDGASGGGGGILPQSFTANDGTALATYDSNWTILAGNFAVNANAVYSNQSPQTSLAQWTAGSFNDDQYAEMKIAAVSTPGIGVAVRTQTGSASGYMLVVLGGGQAGITKIDSGSSSSLYFDFGHNVSVNDVIRLEIQGTTLTYKKNGIVITTVSDSTFSTGRPGLAATSNGTSSTRGDDWNAGSLASQGGGGGGDGGGASP